KELQVFTRQFATLINAGIPVVDSLRILSEGLRSGLLKEASAYVKNQIEGGRRLAESMAQRPAVFDKLYCNMIQAGEEAGILDTILNRLAIYQEKSEKIKSQVRGAMVYPSVIIVVSCVIILGILVFVIPKFEEFYAGSNQELPALTQMISSLSRWLIANWYIAIGAIIGIPFGFKQWIGTPSGRDNFDRFLMNAPIFGEVMRKSAIARLSRTLSTLLSSGVGVLEAIDISARTAGNIVIEQALLRSKEAVSQGRPFAAPIAKEKVFPDMVVQMISIGEQSGSMDVMLGKIADFYEDEVEVSVKAMTSLVEPLLMVVLGGIIAVIVVAMYLPVFNMAGAVGQ
ncbi:MAG TPA: type II secretion system F family protein, partial [Pseudobdellovibrionaceae bacterium]|nr:type II secretion system F family protein [Pseudobdellovibrionaceae bacterium]